MECAGTFLDSVLAIINSGMRLGLAINISTLGDIPNEGQSPWGFHQTVAVLTLLGTDGVSRPPCKLHQTSLFGRIR